MVNLLQRALACVHATNSANHYATPPTSLCAAYRLLRCGQCSVIGCLRFVAFYCVLLYDLHYK